MVAEPVQHRSSVRKVAGRGAFSTPSILDALKEEEKETESVGLVEEEESQYSKNGTVNPFAREDLLGVWKDFVGKIDSPQLKSALCAREPNLNEGWLVEYMLDTELQLNRLTLDIKPKLVGFLRNQLRNDAIEIHFIVSDTPANSTNTPYTDTERWALLVEKYPPLATLKSKFGLDFEHF